MAEIFYLSLFFINILYIYFGINSIRITSSGWKSMTIDFIKYLLFLEIIFFLLIPIIFHVLITIVINFKKIYLKRIVILGQYPHRTWSLAFGHQVVMYDLVSRKYNRERTVFFSLHHEKLNLALHRAFHYSTETIQIYPLFNFNSVIFKFFYSLVSVQLYLFFFKVFYAMNIINEIIDQKKIYKEDQFNNGEIYVGNTDYNSLVKDDKNIGIYIKLLQNDVGLSPYLVESDNKLAESFFSDIDIKEKKFILLHLRKKGIGSTDSTDEFRSVGNQKNYIDAVKYCISKGYAVIGHGETEHDHFKDLEGYFVTPIVKNKFHQDLLNIYLLTNCNYFIGQQSGALILPTSCRIKCIITDNWPLSIGGIHPRNLVLHKPHYLDNKLIDVKHIFTRYKDIAFGFGYKKENIKFAACTSESILRSVKKVISENFFVSEDEIIKSRKYYDKRMRIYHHRNIFFE